MYSDRDADTGLKRSETMGGSKGVKAMAELMAKISEAIEAATKAGLTADQIASVLEMCKETVESED
jgi:hypothetical protein